MNGINKDIRRRKYELAEIEHAIIKQSKIIDDTPDIMSDLEHTTVAFIKLSQKIETMEKNKMEVELKELEELERLERSIRKYETIILDRSVNEGEVRQHLEELKERAYELSLFENIKAMV